MILIIAAFLLFCYIFNKLTHGISRSATCLLGKTALVTGGNAGIGYEVCLNLASRGCRVIIADKDDSNETRKKIINLTKNPNVISKKLDLSSFKSIRKFAAEINSEEEKLDILINNAGIGGSSIEMTEDGLNPVMQINYFGPFLLTHLLIGVLKKSKSARIIFTSSILAFWGDLNTDLLTSGGKSSTIMPALKFYSNSKLATIAASDFFAEKLKIYGITSNSLHPGVTSTKIYNTVPDKATIITLLISLIHYLFGKDVWEAAQTTIHLAVSQDVVKVTGKFFCDCRKFMKPLQANNIALCKKQWKISEECVNLTTEERIC